MDFWTLHRTNSTVTDTKGQTFFALAIHRSVAPNQAGQAIPASGVSPGVMAVAVTAA